MHEANLTRFGPKDCTGTGAISGSFNAIEGDAKIVLVYTDVDGVELSLNDQSIATPSVIGSGEVEIPATLQKKIR